MGSGAWFDHKCQQTHILRIFVSISKWRSHRYTRWSRLQIFAKPWPISNWQISLKVSSDSPLAPGTEAQSNFFSPSVSFFYILNSISCCAKGSDESHGLWVLPNQFSLRLIDLDMMGSMLHRDCTLSIQAPFRKKEEFHSARSDAERSGGSPFHLMKRVRHPPLRSLGMESASIVVSLSFHYLLPSFFSPFIPFVSWQGLILSFNCVFRVIHWPQPVDSSCIKTREILSRLEIGNSMPNTKVSNLFNQLYQIARL